MAYQSLYRRYRSQTFGALIGQDHISGALRNAVRSNTVMHAYLFSGPRGTGKTSTARILAKALNCTDLRDGEPCDVCVACKDVTAGTSMDVNELDAASNNGVDAMRDLVSRAALGTAGRRKVYIVDEVHMLSTAASNALLKTLEEPPDHVVFVLATTDPQKVLQTIISRTQHFQFKLVSVPLLTQHLRFVARDAALELDDSVFEIVARRGNGSVRDALSALDQVVAAGGVDDAVPVLDDILGGLADGDAVRLLEAVGAAVELGREPRQLARDLVERLRQVFLASLAPLLVDASVPEAAAWAGRLPPARATRAIEVLGETLVAMRDSLDPRINLEVALVRLARADLDTSPAALVERLDRIERLLASSAAGSPPPPLVARLAAAPVEPAPSATPSPSPSPSPSPPPARVVPAAAGRGATRSGAADGARAALAATGPSSPSRAPDRRTAGAAGAAESPAVVVSADAGDVTAFAASWPTLLEQLRALNNRAKVLFTSGQVLAVSHEEVTIGLPNEMHRARCEEHCADLERVVTSHYGRPMRIRLGVDPSGGSGGPGVMRDEAPQPDDDPPAVTQRVVRPPAPTTLAHPVVGAVDRVGGIDDEIAEIDLGELTDAEDAAVHSTYDQLLRAFPGAQLVDELPR